MATQFCWGGLALGKELGSIDANTTEADLKKPEKINQLKRTYRILDALGVGKVNGKYCDTPSGLQEKLAKAAADNAAAKAAEKAAKRASKQQAAA